MPRTKEERKKEIGEGEIEENIYTNEGREEMFDEGDEITDLDEGFMRGYGEGAKAAKCPAPAAIRNWIMISSTIFWKDGLLTAGT